MAFASLESLTNELFECIVSCLDLTDIRNLRLACRSTAYKADQDTFRSFFKAKHVELTSTDLTEFVHFTSQGMLGCLVEDLTLLGVVYNPFTLEDVVKNGTRFARQDELDNDWQLQGEPIPCTAVEVEKAAEDLETLRRRSSDDEELREKGADIWLLCEGLRNLATNRPNGMRSISLRIATYRHDATTRLSPLEGRCSRWILEAASRTFSRTTICLRKSGLAFRTLDAFCKKPMSLSCSTPCDAFSRLNTDIIPWGHSLAMLKVLSIGISHPRFTETEFHAQDSGDADQHVEWKLHEQKRDTDTLMAQIKNEQNYLGLSSMLQSCPQLEELEVSYFAAAGLSDSTLRNAHDGMKGKHMHYLAQMEPLSRLRKLRLAGLRVKPNDLVTFLRNHTRSLRDVKLHYLGMRDSDTFNPVFAYISAGEMHLEALHLEDLHDWRGTLLFSGGRACTRVGGAYFGRNVMTRWGPDVKKPISYYHHQGRSIDTPRTRAWHLRKKEEFGGR